MALTRPTASSTSPPVLTCLDGALTADAQQRRSPSVAGDGPPTERQTANPHQRAREMAALRQQGLSLDEVARRYGVSRERVRQILQVHGGPARREVISARHRRAEEQLTAHADELLALWRGGAQLRHAAVALGLPLTACRAAITRLATERDCVQRRASLASSRVIVTTYSDADIIRAVRGLAAGLQRVPSAADYAPVGREPGYPSLATVINRMDGWSNAVRAAGLTEVATPERARARRWTEEACWTALRRVAAELGEIPTIARYDRHATGRTGLPSSATLRNRLGRWSVITTQLAIERDARGTRPPQSAHGHAPCRVIDIAAFAAGAATASLVPPTTSAAKTASRSPQGPPPAP